MLQWNNVSKRFGSKIVADTLSLTVRRGELVAILGRSGSGKSTLLNMAAGLVAPDAGQILFNGVDETRTPPEHRQFALMFQDYALLPHLNVWQNVAFGLRLRGIGKKAARTTAETMLAEVGLVSSGERAVSRLSGGEQQRVALARALVIQPRALLLDEPFSALDTTLRASLRQLTSRLVKQQACPSVLVTHSPAEALSMADCVCLLHQGRWLQQGRPGTLLAAPASAEAAQLLGCDNVSAAHYIPQSAIYWNDARGRNTTVSAVSLQADIISVRLHHPVFGEIGLYLPLSSGIPVIGQTVRVWVNPAQIIGFTAPA